MNDQRLIEELSGTTNKSEAEIEKILNRIDSKLSTWISELDSNKINFFLPILISKTVESNYLIVRILKSLERKQQK